MNAFDQLERDLVQAARKHAAPRRPQRLRRRALVAAAAAIGLLGAVAGATALTGFSTGVPAVDELLEWSSEIHDRASDELADRGALPPGAELPDFRPGPGGASPPIEVPALSGSGNAVGVAYASGDGGICFASAAPKRAGDDAPRGGVGGCIPADQLSKRLARKGASFGSSAASGGSVTFQGYAHEDVRAVRVWGPDGPVDARLAEPWTPTLPGAEPIRVFIAVVEIDAGEDGIQPHELDFMTQARMEAEFADGRVVIVEP